MILLELLLVANGFDGRLGFIARPNSVTARYHVTEIYLGVITKLRGRSTN